MGSNNQNNNSTATFIICVAIFVGAILSLYFLSKILVWIGPILAVISLIILLMGINNEDQDLIIIGVIGIIIGLVLLGFGLAGVNFFEENATGKNLLGASNTIVDATKQSIQVSTNTVK